MNARNGLLKMDSRQYKFELKPFDVGNAEIENIVSRADQLWVGTNAGLYMLDDKSGKRSVFRKDAGQNSLKSNEISKLYLIAKGYYGYSQKMDLIATMSGGKPLRITTTIPL